MYSIAKLLSDEPKKLESLILAVLKLLITVWFAQLILGFKTNLSEFSTDSFFQNFKVDQSIYFVLTSIGFWYLIWELIVELGIGFLIFLLSRMGNNEYWLNRYLWATVSIKLDEERIIDSKPNILHFTERFDAEPFLIHSRAHQVFSIGIVSFIILLCSDIMLAGWQKFLCGFVLVNFLVISVLQRKLHDYYSDHSILLRSKFYPLGQLQKLKNIIDQIDLFKTAFSIESKRKAIYLAKSKDVEFLPEKIKVVNMYHFNRELGSRVINTEYEQRMLSRLNKEELTVICSNFFKPDKRITKLNDQVYCVNAESEEEIFNGFEELLFILKQEHYGRKRLSRTAFPKF